MESMTGFGLSEKKWDSYAIKIQLKSVNHRYLDLKIKGLSEEVVLEAGLRDYLQRRFNRGHIDIYVEIEKLVETKFSINDLVFQQYYDLLRLVKDKVDESAPIDLPWLLSREGVIVQKSLDVDQEEFRQNFFLVVEEACDSLKEMRIVEGQSLYKKLKEDINRLVFLTKEVEKATRLSKDEMIRNMRNRIEEIQKEYELDESRFATELALMLDKLTIEEEIVRLSSHIEQFNVIMNYEDPIGRKLDFLLQEMNREANTMGSKSRNIEVLHEIVEIKSIIENLREQVQNIE